MKTQEQKRKAYETVKRYRARHPERRVYQNRKAALKFLYGLTPESFDAMAQSQMGRCVICKCLPKKLVVDHNHITGKIRGLLCTKCNPMLGMANDAPEILIAAANYLTDHKE